MRNDYICDVGIVHPSPRPSGCGKLFSQKFQWASTAKCSHRFSVAPSKVYFEFFVQFFHIGELLPIVEVPLVVAVAAFYLAVVPRRSGWDQLVKNSRLFQRNIKRTFFCIADVFIGELRAIVCLDCLYLKWKRLLEHSEEFHRVLWGMFLKAVDKPYSGTFIDSRPLIQMLPISLCGTF